MPEQLLTILKLCLLILLYLFFLRVLRAVWAEVNGPKLKPMSQRKADKAQAKATTTAQRTGEKRRKKTKPPAGAALEVIEPLEQKGRHYALDEELTVGRAAGCHVTLDDTFVSQIHARVFKKDGLFYVEDLGSTNGTYLNRAKVAGPMQMKDGDHLQIGSTVMVLA